MVGEAELIIDPVKVDGVYIFSRYPGRSVHQGAGMVGPEISEAVVPVPSFRGRATILLLLVTVTETAAEVVVLPSTSRARAVKCMCRW